MLTPKDILGHISAGRVLDVATGAGGFIHFLMEGLAGYTEITGIDANPKAATAFAAAFQDKPDISFQTGDALQLDFPDACFDLVCISNSLHHFDEPQRALRQMERVLRPGGRLIVSEMYCDGQTDTQMTHVHLHHWWAAVDRSAGIVHHDTYTRAELVELVSALRLTDLAFYDLADTDEDPKAPQILAELTPVFDRYIQRAASHPDLQARGEALRARVAEIGFHGATTLLAVGVKSK